jgi:hypothetical protein
MMVSGMARKRTAEVSKPGARCLAAASLLGLFVAAGCTESGSSVPSSEKPPTSTTASAAEAVCTDSRRMSTDQGIEIQGTTEVGELWALGGDPRMGDEFKMIIRGTGAGELSVVAVSPSGSPLVPNSVVPHVGSNFDRPGDEWGVFFTFDEPGCWRIEVDRAELRGFITLRVVSA